MKVKCGKNRDQRSKVYFITMNIGVFEATMSRTNDRRAQKKNLSYTNLPIRVPVSIRFLVRCHDLHGMANRMPLALLSYDGFEDYDHTNTIIPVECGKNHGQRSRVYYINIKPPPDLSCTTS